jgi:hypothetical protein
MHISKDVAHHMSNLWNEPCVQSICVGFAGCGSRVPKFKLIHTSLLRLSLSLYRLRGYTASKLSFISPSLSDEFYNVSSIIPHLETRPSCKICQPPRPPPPMHSARARLSLPTDLARGVAIGARRYPRHSRSGLPDHGAALKRMRLEQQPLCLAWSQRCRRKRSAPQPGQSWTCSRA